jgi:hypothetical protein
MDASFRNFCSVDMCRFFNVYLCLEQTWRRKISFVRRLAETFNVVFHSIPS